MRLTIIAIAILCTGCVYNPQAGKDLTQIPKEGEAIAIETIKNDESAFKPYYSISDTLNRYRGNWFDIDVPKGFIAKPTDVIVHEEQVFDTEEAYFTSPDGLVEFYVFSPLWRGNPKYLTVKETEELVDTKTEVTDGQYGKDETIFTTVKAKDGGYTRSFVSIRQNIDSGSDTLHAFGIQYASQAAYDQYKTAYEAFKHSLVQYAD